MKTFNRYNSVILLDLNYIGIRSAYRFREFSYNVSGTNVLTGSVFGVLQLIQSLSVNYPFSKIFICNDGKRSIEDRKKLFENYKGSRRDPQKTPDIEIRTWRTLKPELFHMLGGLPNVIGLESERKEADDLMAKLAFVNADAGKSVCIFTSDKDLLQCTFRPEICASKELDNGELVILQEDYTLNHKDLGVLPEVLPYFRPFRGDPSDDIPAAVSRVSTDILRKLAQKWHDSQEEFMTSRLMESFIDTLTDVNVTKVTREKLLAGIPDLNRNYQLMNLVKYQTETIDQVKRIAFGYNEKLIEFYGLNKYLEWRRGTSLSAINANVLV